MVKGCFRVYRDQVNPNEIHFEISPDAPLDKPEDQLRLRDDVDETLRVLKALYPPPAARFEEYFRPLLSLAQAGLVGDTADPVLATRALGSLRKEITGIEAGRIKNRYMRTLGKNAMWIGGSGLLLGIASSLIYPQAFILAYFAVLWGACMAGVWLSFGIRKTALQFSDLLNLEEDQLEPPIRLVFAGLLTLAFGLLVSTRAVVITIGEVTSANFVGNFEIALLLGLLCGVSEAALPSKLASHASQFIGTSKDA